MRQVRRPLIWMPPAPKPLEQARVNWAKDHGRFTMSCARVYPGIYDRQIVTRVGRPTRDSRHHGFFTPATVQQDGVITAVAGRGSEWSQHGANLASLKRVPMKWSRRSRRRGIDRSDWLARVVERRLLRIRWLTGLAPGPRFSNHYGNGLA